MFKLKGLKKAVKDYQRFSNIKGLKPFILVDMSNGFIWAQEKWGNALIPCGNKNVFNIGEFMLDRNFSITTANVKAVIDDAYQIWKSKMEYCKRMEELN